MAPVHDLPDGGVGDRRAVRVLGVTDPGTLDLNRQLVDVVGRVPLRGHTIAGGETEQANG